jgi:transposase
MPYKHTEKLINRKDDRRVKLSPQDRVEIFDLYAAGISSQRELARVYGVSRRLIQFIVDPAKAEANKQRAKERGGYKRYYDKEKRKVYMKNHRHYKQELYLQGKLEDK